ncbi:MAG: PD-(D/E)XK nuclease family protein [Candidatus Aenigmarchaeota archaeon]|nr:PD-(D/E)XK nuclease family protein [Candidatus Aenigmarchaeota archaeon]MCX8190800.1 PD-(D/E)XK nuclease family protein [Candidatus Aenigmarchaeota archaeon]MDW8160047.1 PD-(D/E)XK nuclease family protein [Candidatus Aenigmarchaeota archaeon]
MRFTIEYEDSNVEKILEILNDYVGKEISIFELEKDCLKKNVISVDYLFIILQHLSLKKVIEASKGVVKVNEKINEELAKEIKDLAKKKITTNSKTFFTPLEVSKFFQCPRRFWLEKIVLSKQEKEKVGKVWDGEAIHVAIKNLIENLGKKDEESLIEESAKIGMESFQGSIEIKKEEMIEILKKFLECLKKENFDLILPERTIITLKLGLVGSVDLVGFRGEEIVPIEVKHGSYRGRLKKEHILQSVGEALLIGSYFRKRIKNSYIFYSQTNSLVKIDILPKHLKNFLRSVMLIKKMCSSDRIPPKSRLQNYRERVCKGCHVKNACENIEKMKRKS